MDISTVLLNIRPGASWTLNGETYDGLTWLDEGQPKPTLSEIEAWTAPNVKIWRNVQEFMKDFTMSEKAAVALSTDPTLAALRLELSTWFSTVHSNDSRVVMGLDKMVELGIISADRKTEIITI